ncbi:GntR family transcriptional regulator [Chelatococcus asaccharovorans]|uniref:GntR family transcriptional regulator n=1 Tax=Chelatococcus asaccharovorans TaxID=28210 RepID=UPI00224C72A6|nr:GntR family transcriptional regulator [Chelatococcus asaccharovorans]CAH1672361.1 GntR family transcriptional regulator [Chelatococcus asaccharovorans]CAH1676234.1 GntR family transcriptional regulator [Chelatococcus asaccharovorans]
MAQTRSQSTLTAVDIAEPAAPRRRNRVNLFDLAYERLEDLIVNCELKPGRFLAIQDLQDISGFGRTPVHQAVSRLAADTLVIVRPRHGVQIAPIDLARERVLLRLRRDLERFVIRLATEKSGPSHRNQLLHLARALREHRETLTLSEFNTFDRRIDQLILAAAGEPFLEHTLRPLHTLFRRIGWIFHNRIASDQNFGATVDSHLAILDAIAGRQVDEAVAASDALMDFVDSMFDIMEREVDPSLLDCNLAPFVSPASTR